MSPAMYSAATAAATTETAAAAAIEAMSLRAFLYPAQIVKIARLLKEF